MSVNQQIILKPLATCTRDVERAPWLLQRVWFSPQRSRLALLAPLAAVAAVVAVGLPQLRWNDGIADLNRIDPAVKAEDEQQKKDAEMRQQQERERIEREKLDMQA